MYGSNGLRKTGNVEQYLSYDKLQRTGRLLKGLKVKREVTDRGFNVTLYNRVPYASEHETGGSSARAVIKEPFVKNGASGVVTGGKITARPFMKPSRRVLNTPYRELGRKMKSFGW